jgi:hypothetical protein
MYSLCPQNKQQAIANSWYARRKPKSPQHRGKTRAEQKRNTALCLFMPAAAFFARANKTLGKYKYLFL